MDFLDGDMLIIVPPFTKIGYPSIAAHTLQSYAKKHSIKIKVFYANLALARFFDHYFDRNLYNDFCQLSISKQNLFLGERFFFRTVYGKRPFAVRDERCLSFLRKHIRDSTLRKVVFDVERHVSEWLTNLTDSILNSNYKIIGCTSSFQQVLACISIFNVLKRCNKDIITIIGGANCEGEMAAETLSLSKNINYVFSGESELSLVDFIKNKKKSNSEHKVIKSIPLQDINQIPCLDYSEYLQQLDLFYPYSDYKKTIWLQYQTSRGCWWGEKKTCTFCGVNGTSVCYKEKDPKKVLNELKSLRKSWPNNNIMMVDSIFPHTYFKTLLPKLVGFGEKLNIFYEVKSNISFEQMLLLKKAGINRLQPGIESLSTSLLRRMNKGCSAKTNIIFLRNAMSMNLDIVWLLLYGFPGDTKLEYEDTLKLIPYIIHLKPPAKFSRISIDRFSLYFRFPEKYNIDELNPLGNFKDLFPMANNIDRLSIMFDGKYPSYSLGKGNEIIKKLHNSIRKWQKYWENGKEIPKLEVIDKGENNLYLLDTRGLSKGKKRKLKISTDQAKILLNRDYYSKQYLKSHSLLNWALSNKFLYEIDSCYIPLVTSTSYLIQKYRTDTN